MEKDRMMEIFAEMEAINEENIEKTKIMNGIIISSL